ncbi:hypothetical protein [Legionella nautarum]|uniref:hypothetical protein n=1 Tax=Legionella nautarum TaxID=45070 RepID=UPI000AAD73B6|nr:hypothetical protein [Legionella nautarum]
MSKLTNHKALSEKELKARKGVHSFLQQMVCREHEQVKAMLEKDISLLFKREKDK